MDWGFYLFSCENEIMMNILDIGGITLKIVTYTYKEKDLLIRTDEATTARWGWVEQGYVVDAELAAKWVQHEKGMGDIPLVAPDVLTLLNQENGLSQAKQMAFHLAKEPIEKWFIEGEPVALPLDEVELLSPLPIPRSFRDFYAFEQHVKTARKNRGLEMIPEWYEIPVFYFSNHHAFVGPEQKVKKPAYTHCLDFELEVACVIGKKGKNIPRDQAIEYIAGFAVLNDWSARDVQKKEMKVGLGPAKGKDFATSFGPYLVTLDELEDRRQGEHWDLKMTARINGKEVSHGNLKDLYFSFSQMIERASAECELVPGDVIGSGTVGTGCLLELGQDVHPWLKEGDVVELEVEGIGILRNQVV